MRCLDQDTVIGMKNKMNSKLHVILISAPYVIASGFEDVSEVVLNHSLQLAVNKSVFLS